jgi:hypothetical protein
VVIKSEIEGAHQLTADLAAEHAKTFFANHGQLATYLVALYSPGAWEKTIAGENNLDSGQPANPINTVREIADCTE